jgi:hypothetical protein
MVGTSACNALAAGDKARWLADKRSLIVSHTAHRELYIQEDSRAPPPRGEGLAAAKGVARRLRRSRRPNTSRLFELHTIGAPGFRTEMGLYSG